MPNSYSQVAWTYYRHFRSMGRFWAIASCLLLFFTIPVGVATRSDIAGPMIIVFLFPIAGLVYHIQDQFHNPSVQLMPNYRRAHIPVSIAAVLILTVIFPFALTFFSGTRSVCLVACCTIFFAITLWACFGNVLWMMFFSFVYILALGTETGSIYAKDFFEGKHESLGYALALFGLAISAWGLAKLYLLTEDDPAYLRLERFRSIELGNVDQNLNTALWFSKGKSDRLADRHIARLSRHARHASVSGWSRVCRWQLGMNVALLLRSLSIFSSFIFFGVFIYFQQGAAASLNGKESSLMVPVMFSNIIPLFTLVLLQTHRPSREVLLPVERASYIREIGWSIFLFYLTAWAISWPICILLMTQVFRLSMPLMMIVDLLLISAFTSILFFGVTAWMSLCRSMFLRILAMIIPIGIQIVLMMIAVERDAGAYAPLMVVLAAVAGMFGLLITFFSYRRWLTADLG